MGWEARTDYAPADVKVSVVWLRSGILSPSLAQLWCCSAFARRSARSKPTDYTHQGTDHADFLTDGSPLVCPS
jgi:hypothetical protein